MTVSVVHAHKLTISVSTTANTRPNRWSCHHIAQAATLQAMNTVKCAPALVLPASHGANAAAAARTDCAVTADCSWCTLSVELAVATRKLSKYPLRCLCHADGGSTIRGPTVAAMDAFGAASSMPGGTYSPTSSKILSGSLPSPTTSGGIDVDSTLVAVPPLVSLAAALAGLDATPPPASSTFNFFLRRTRCPPYNATSDVQRTRSVGVNMWVPRRTHKKHPMTI